MNAFLLECLYPTGWRRMDELHWRFADASDAAAAMVADASARAVRVLPVTVQTDAILTLERSSSSTQDGQGGKRG